MTKEVLVTIRGLQNGPDTDGQPIEMTTAGVYFNKNNKHYVLYEEVMEGEIQTTKNRLKVADGIVELNKTGVVNVNMIFKEHQKNITHYETPYGCLSMGIDTKKVLFEETENEMKVSVFYALEMNQEFVADCDIQIIIKSKGAGQFKLV